MSLFGDAPDRGAVISPDGRYRYTLWRQWGPGSFMAWVMLNPSTADADVDDPTIRRCIGFARREGYGGIVVRNLFAFRTPSPAVLRQAHLAGEDVVGPENDRWLLHLPLSPTIGCIVAAWGSPAAWVRPRIERARRDILPHDLFRLDWGTGAAPHPLYVAADAPFVPA